MALWKRVVLLVALVAADDIEVALEASDDCHQTASCALNALQLRSDPSEPSEPSEPAEPAEPSTVEALSPAEAKAEAKAAEADLEAEAAGFKVEGVAGEVEAEVEATLEGRGWWPGGDKLWGSGHGLEDIKKDDVAYYDAGMRAAAHRCGDAACALIVNPMHHRTVEQFHIHFFHYQGKYAADLKSRVEKITCGKSGWHHGHLPCHGTAMFASGFPNVFSLAMEHGSIDHASVIVWPSACGGQGTIIELAYHCSIEHQIRGDFDPSKR